MMPVDAAPACADNLPLVDAAFGRGKKANAAARELGALCRLCPVAAECFAEGMARPEHGVWAGIRRTVISGGYPAGRIKAVA